MKKLLACFLASLASAAVMKDAVESAITEKKMRSFKSKFTPDREVAEQTTGR